MFDQFMPNFYREGQAQAPKGIPEAQRILQGLLSELPDEAKALVEKTEREAARIEEQASEEGAVIREQANQQVSEIESRAENRRKMIFQHAIDQLEPLQKELFRVGELGKALAVFVQMQSLKARAVNVLPDPGSLVPFQSIGKTFHFQVTGNSRKPV